MTDDPARPSLSATELEILRQLATGATNREIARERGISEATVKKHVTNINNKLGTGNRTEAARRALELGLVTVEREDQPSVIDGDAARRLADELDRARAHSRRIARVSVALALTAFAAALLVIVFAFDDVVQEKFGGPTITPTPGSTATPSPSGSGWLPGRDLPSPRSGLALVSDGSGLYAIGGQDESGVLSDTLRYDVSRIDWRRVAPKPTAVRDVLAVLLSGRIVVPGGCLANGKASDVVEVYDPRVDKWSPAPALPEPVCAYALAEHNGRAYLFGGRSGPAASSASDRVWRLEPDTQQWVDAGRMPLKRADLAAVTVDDRIHLLGGVDATGAAQASHWAFSPVGTDDRWNTEGGPPLPEPRAGLAAASISRRVFVVGGGWDRSLDEGALVWDASGQDDVWRRYAEPRGPTPYRGLGMAVHMGQWLHIAGGSVDGRLLHQNQAIQAVWTILLPQPPR